MIGKIKNFFREVFVEAKKVDWPNRQQTFRYTALVVGLSLVTATILGLLDTAFLKGLIENIVL